MKTGLADGPSNLLGEALADFRLVPDTDDDDEDLLEDPDALTGADWNFGHRHMVLKIILSKMWAEVLV